MTALLWPHLRPQLRALVVALLVGLLIAALGAAQPLLTRVVIDQGLIGRHFDRLVAACAGMVMLAVAGLGLGAVHRLLYVRASGRALFSLRASAYAHLMRVSPRRLAALPVGDLVSRLDGDVAEVQRFGTDSVATLVSSVLTVAAAGAVMLSLSWRLTVLVAAVMPLQLVVRHYARGPIERSTRAVREAAARVGSFLIETLGGARTVQGAAAEARERDRLVALGDDYLGRVQHAQLVSFGAASVAGLIGHLTTAATFVAGGWLVLSDATTVGTLVAFVAYLGRTAGSASALAGLYTGYQRARVSLGRVRELLDLPVVTESGAARAIAPAARGELSFERVSLDAPQGGRRLLDDVSGTIPAGTKLLLGGASGVGKTTFTDLLRRFIEPSSGTIRLDGVPLPEFRLADLRRRIVVVEHSPLLFRGTILDNLRYGNEVADEAAVLEAAVHAGVDEFVRDFEGGYHTVVGEGGAGLSTGQRQRIAIARAALSDPLVVILDEATSGLDAEAARRVHRALDDSFPQRTRIVITHRGDDLEGVTLGWRLVDGRVEDLAGRRS